MYEKQFHHKNNNNDKQKMQVYTTKLSTTPTKKPSTMKVNLLRGKEKVKKNRTKV